MIPWRFFGRYMEVLDIENPSFDHLDRVGVMGFILNV
jgi:hypothetical protein